MGKKWKGIEIEFGTDKNSNKSYKQFNRFKFFHGYSYPEIISNWDAGSFSEYRATRHISSSFPTGLRMKRFNKQVESSVRCIRDTESARLQRAAAA